MRTNVYLDFLVEEECMVEVSRWLVSSPCFAVGLVVLFLLALFFPEIRREWEWWHEQQVEDKSEEDDGGEECRI